ncbi:MAG: archease [Desulfobacterales bacterium]|nr:archease [Desulfobacterales bacterium]
MNHPTYRGWRLMDHTADTGLVIESKDLPTLFAQAAEGLFEMIAERRGSRADQRTEVAVTGVDWPDLMFCWLRELLGVWTGGERIPVGVRILQFAPYWIRAEVKTATYDPAVHRLGEEIKAVTYHQLRVEELDGGWRAQVIFDV